MNLAFSIFVLGGLGALARWGLSSFIFQLTNRLWAGTLLVNSLGSILFFLILKKGWPEHHEWNLALRLGLLGGLTTFSTFSYELATLYIERNYLELALCFLLNMIFGVVIGIFILR